MAGENPFHGGQFDFVAERRRGAVGVDVIDVLGVGPGPFQRRFHAPLGAAAVFRRRGNVMGVAGQAEADDLGHDIGAAGLGVLQLFEHQGPGPVAHDEAVAVLVPGPGRLLRSVVEARRQRPGGAEPGHAEPAYGGLGAAGDHHVGIFQHDKPGRVADRMRPGGTRRDDGMVGALEPESDRHVSRHQVDQAGGNEKRADAPDVAAFDQHRVLGDLVQAADARADHDPGAHLVFLGFRRPAGIGDRLDRRRQTVDDEIVHAPLILRRHPVIGVEQPFGRFADRHLAGDFRRQVADIEGLDGADAGFSGQQFFPVDLNPTPQGGQKAQTGNNHTSHCLLAFQRLQEQLE